MSYTVVWLRAVERRLTELWNTAPDRQSIADAADKIDAVLRQSPSSVGESWGTCGDIDRRCKPAPLNQPTHAGQRPDRRRGVCGAGSGGVVAVKDEPRRH